MARLTERAFENAVVRLRDGQGALGQSALDVLHEQREELANQMLARLAGSDEFAAMLERNFGPYRRLMTYYECAMMEVETKFRVLDAEFGLQHDRNPIESIKSRLKSTDSLAKKLARKGFPMSVDSIEENIFDVAGVRVVCTFPEDMFSLAESLLSQDDVRLIERRDYVASRVPQFASHYRGAHFPRARETLGEGGSAAAHHLHELLGIAGASAALQEGSSRRRGRGGGRGAGRSGRDRRRSRSPHAGAAQLLGRRGRVGADSVRAHLVA